MLAASTEQGDVLRDYGAPPWLWAAFIVAVVILLVLDLFVFHRRAHVISLREATLTSLVWIFLGVGFAGVIWATLGSGAAAQYLTGYVIEESLSIDNVFVWAVIFSYFSTPDEYRHRVLFWGIFGAVILRAGFVFAGVALLERLEWLLFVFGGLLIVTAVRVARHHPGEIHPERNPVLRVVRRVMPVTASFDGQRLFTRVDGRRIATPLFVTLVLIETTDIVFAVDSVPAILAISRDPFIVLSSNITAILGLRALFFVLAGAQGRLVHLNTGLAVILGFVGAKMIVSHWYHIPALPSLGVIAVVLAITTFTSLRDSAPPDESNRFETEAHR